MSDSVIPWTVACQAPPSMGVFQARNWSGLPFPSPGDLPDLGIKPESPALQEDSLPPVKAKLKNNKKNLYYTKTKPTYFMSCTAKD